MWGGIIGLAIAGTALVLSILKNNPKKGIKKQIEKLGGLAYYNYAAAAAKKKGLIEGDAKLSSMDEIHGLDDDKIALVLTVLGLVADEKVSTGPARDEHGNFIKTEKEGE